MTHTRLYRDGVLVQENFPPDQISEALAADERAIVWLDLCAPEGDDFNLIRAEFGLHALAVEDALAGSERPKLDRYRTHLFLTAYAVDLDAKHGTLASHEVAAFITERALITVRKDESFDIAQVVERWDSSDDLAKHGVAFLVYGLLDFLVDGHFAAVQELDSAIESLEDLLFTDRRSTIQAVQRRSYRLRKSLVVLRRVVLPMREVVNSLMRPTMHVVQEPMLPYFQDVYDHVLRVTEWTESLRDLVTTIQETNLTVQGNRFNSIMKKVTSWAAIIAVPTAITGFYGQNVPFPGYEKSWGVLVSAILTVGVSVSLYIAFRRRDWL
jgi:magnesium transporter